MKSYQLPGTAAFLLLAFGSPIAISASPAQFTGELEEVVVTASKRGATRVQDIAGNISVLGGEDLRNAGANGIADFEKYIPGMSSVQTSPGSTRIIIRGLSSVAGSVQVGVYYDEIPAVGRIGPNVFLSDLQLFDIQRLEVLRGPQGTLYGSGSQGGTVRYITNKPDLTYLGGAAGAEFGTRSRDAGQAYSYHGVLNVPVVEDVFALRGVVFREEVDGYVDFPNLGLTNMGDRETVGGRLMASWMPGESTQLLASVWYQKMEAEDAGLVEVIHDIRSSRVLQPAHDELWMYNLTLEKQAAGGNITASVSYAERETFYSFDVSQFFLPEPGFPASINQHGETGLFSGELRYASQFSGPLQLIIGAFYQDRDTPESGLGNGYFVDPDTGLPPASATERQSFFGSSTSEQFTNQAVFGELTYQLTERLEMLAGFRAFELDSESRSEELLSPFGPPAGLGPVLKSSHTDEVFKFQLTYDVDDSALVYLLYSEGFREGGPNAVGLTSRAGIPVQASYAPDNVQNYEFGWKTQIADAQLTFNGSLYYMDWSDIQVRLLEANGAFPYIENSGEASLYGLELETRLRPEVLNGFTLMVNVGYASQKLDEDSPGFSIGDITAGREGDSLPDAADFTASIVADQTFTLFDHEAFVSLDASFTGEALSEFSRRSPRARETGDYWLVGARVGIERPQWSASLFVRNLFDKRAPIAWAVDEVPGLPDKLFTTEPRMVGLNFDVRF